MFHIGQLVNEFSIKNLSNIKEKTMWFIYIKIQNISTQLLCACEIVWQPSGFCNRDITFIRQAIQSIQKLNIHQDEKTLCILQKNLLRWFFPILWQDVFCYCQHARRDDRTLWSLLTLSCSWSFHTKTVLCLLDPVQNVK